MSNDTAGRDQKWLIDRENLSLADAIDDLREEYLAAANSLYRWWWESLRESEDYAAALRGERGEPFASMAKDFGELGDDFALWWLSRGRILFGQQVHPFTVGEVDVLDGGSTSDRMTIWKDAARPTLYLRIPLTLERREIMSQVGELVDLNQQKQLVAIQATKEPRRAIYPDQRIRPATIKTLMEVWRLRKNTGEDWWKIGENLALRDDFTTHPNDSELTVKRKRRLMSQTVHRYHAMAGKLIEFAARGEFPRVK